MAECRFGADTICIHKACPMWKQCRWRPEGWRDAHSLLYEMTRYISLSSADTFELGADTMLEAIEVLAKTKNIDLAEIFK